MSTQKRQPKKRILYSNYCLRDLYDDAAQYLLEEHGEEWGWRTVKDIPDNKIWDEVYFTDECYREDFLSELKDFINDNGTFLLVGSIGLWDGVHRGGFMFSSIDELGKAWKDCNYMEFYDENGHLYLRCSHHDGTNCYEIKKVTQAGIDYYEAKDDECWRDEIIRSRMWAANRLTALPHFAHTVYGCKKVEYESKKAS